MYTASGRHFLPIEIQRNIVGWLTLPSLKALRLASKTFAALGAEYLLPEVHLLYRTASLDRLEAICRHPIISQHVTTLFYEADRLNHFANQGMWYMYVEDYDVDADVKDAGQPASPSVVPLYAAAPETWALYRDRASYRDLELTRGWKNYLDFCNEQQDIATRNLDQDQIARAIACFPKLSHIYFSINARIRPFSNALVFSYAPGLVMPEGEFASDLCEPAGFRQYMSLMLALVMGKADPRSPLAKCTQQGALRTLHVGAVSWKIFFFFCATWSAQKLVERTIMTHVTDVKLILHIKRQEEGGGSEVIHCRRFFNETGALRKFLTAAPKLEKMHVEFTTRDPEWKGLDLCDLVGDDDFTWTALRQVNFEVSAQEEKLMAFLTRHKTTLRRLTMENGLTLVGPGGSAATLLTRMRDAVQWEGISLAGSLSIESAGAEWLLGMPRDEEDDEPESARLKRGIHDFLMRRSDVNPFELSSE